MVENVTAKSAEQRHWERQAYQTVMTLVLKSGRIIEGTTLNVSPGGILFGARQSAGGVALDEEANLYISPTPHGPHFSCSVSRVEGDQIGLRFLSDTAFGAYISHDMLLKLISDINNAFAGSLDLQTTIETSVSQIKDHLLADASSLFLISPDQETVVCSACAGPVDITGMELPISEGIVGHAIRDNKPQVVHHVEDDPFFSHAVDDQTGFRTLSLLCAPLTIQGKTIGALEVVNKRGTGLFTTADEVALMALASATALAIHNARQAEALIDKESKIRAAAISYAAISSLNHRLHTPLNAVLGFAQLLETEDVVVSSPTCSEAVAQITAGGRSLANVVDEILNFADIESQTVHINMTNLNPQDIVQAVISDTERLATSNSIGWENSRIDTAALPGVVADGVRLKQVLENILHYAIRASLEEAPVVMDIEQQGPLARFVIGFADSIWGTRDDDDPFRPSSIGDQGLDLIIAKRLIELMGGDSGIDRLADRKTEIWFTLAVA